MEGTFGPLLPLYERERSAGRALALGILVRTRGSTYRKAGALILMAADGEYAGLISGGCLESDLLEHARTVIAEGTARTVCYDARTGDDLLWGMGLGCEGAMDILLLRAGPGNAWQPLAHLAAALAAHEPTAIAVVVESSAPDASPGNVVLPATVAAGTPPPPPLASPAVAEHLRRAAACGATFWLESGGSKLFVLPLALPPRILVLGGGPDAVPVVELAARLAWKVTVVDHRERYADVGRFPAAERVLQARPEALPQVLNLSGFAAAIVMSHHLLSDLGYLRALARSAIPYVGLLGPAVRRQRLLAELREDARLLERRLRAPVGLPLGGRTPESIALAIVAELHAFVHGADPRSPGS